MSTALSRAREGIIGTETIAGIGGSFTPLSKFERYARLTGDHKRAVMASELLNDLKFVKDPDWPKGDLASSTLYCATKSKKKKDDFEITFSRLVGLSRPSDDDFKRDLSMVANYAELRGDRLPEIHTQLDDIMSYFGAISQLHPNRSSATMELLFTGIYLASVVAMEMKLTLGCPRPVAFSDRLQPMIQTPDHATFPSGHSTQSFLVATLMTELAAGDTSPAEIDPESQYYRMAARIAANRTVAGVHFPSDSAAGAVLGITLGQYLASRARDGAQTVTPRSFGGHDYHDGKNTRDFHFGELHKLMGGNDKSVAELKPITVTPAPMLQNIWDGAVKEWDSRWT
ncbi:phosphatase PAP2 family protein [uncultured Litoreibacter sp.]|uniref:phosphatase PAP2 family protein n=1 Tax=uncultured Litoreibacter sp. TaxID=1392394 RepID=UPI0026158F9E|nr:phosphatase PAP2 family protein [uncultured Litoreibacter sp.]